MRNLGKAVGILLMHEMSEAFMHADVEAFHAPSECHGLVARGQAKRARRARKHAEAVAGAPWRVIRNELRRRLGVNLGRRCDSLWQHPVAERWAGRMYPQHFPF